MPLSLSFRVLVVVGIGETLPRQRLDVAYGASCPIASCWSVVDIVKLYV
jgi:hypothetical protein